MWKKGQKRKEENIGGSELEGAPAPKRSFRKGGGGGEGEDHVIFQISKNRRLAVRTFAGKIVVDIREYYVKDGKELPGKKGISLTMDQWDILEQHMDAIDEAFGDDS